MLLRWLIIEVCPGEKFITSLETMNVSNDNIVRPHYADAIVINPLPG